MRHIKSKSEAKKSVVNKTKIQTQIFEDDYHKIYQGDVLQVLSTLADSSVNLIFADPPYNIGKDFDGLIENWKEEDFLNWAYEWIDE